MEAPTHLSIAGKDRDGVTIEIGAQLCPADAVPDLRFEIRIALPFRLRIFEGLARPQVERAVVLDLEAFKRRLESSPSRLTSMPAPGGIVLYPISTPTA